MSGLVERHLFINFTAKEMFTKPKVKIFNTIISYFNTIDDYTIINYTK